MDARKFFYEFGRIIYHIDGIYDEYAKKSGVSPSLLWILYALNDCQLHTQHDICIDWGLPKSTVNTVVTGLKNNGYVELEHIKGKRREMAIILTDKGKEYADEILKDIYNKEAEIFKSLNSDDINVINTLVKIKSLLESEM